VVTGDPQRARRIVDDLKASVGLDACRPYADRLLGLEIEALAATGQRGDALRLLATLEPAPGTQLLRARLQRLPDHDVRWLLAARADWPEFERLQAELLLHTDHGASACDELVELVTACGKSRWVLPFLSLGPRVERILQSMPLEDLHPQLARTLAYLAPVASATSHGPSGADEPASGVRLTRRELTLVELLPTHLSYAAIGDRLFLSVNTVKSNLKAVYRKLDVTTRADAVEASRRAGLIT
jgi:DNA-binding CsgD family transcriptional regulator